YKNRYQVSSLGRIRSVDRLVFIRDNAKRISRGKILSLGTNELGYKFVILYKKNIGKVFRVHRLVAIHFIKKRKNRPEVNHIDGIKSNNYASNLEWCNRKENLLHAIRTGLRSSKHKGRCL